MWGTLPVSPLLCFPPKLWKLILNLSDKFSYCPSDLNLNLGNFQRNFLGFYKLAAEMAISPGLVSDGAFCLSLQTLFGSLSLKELREWMECVRNVGLEAGSLSSLLLTLDGLPEPGEFTDDSGFTLFPPCGPKSRLCVLTVHGEGWTCNYLQGETCFHLVPGESPETGRKHFDLGATC